MIRHHPPICQVHVFLKLDCKHLRIYLDHGANQPVPHALAFFILVVAIDFDPITHPIRFALIWSARKIKFRQICLRQTKFCAILPHFGFDLMFEARSDTIKGNTLHNRIKKAFNNQSLGIFQGDTPAAQV